MKKIKAEIFSRVAGYFRPVQNWNIGKKEEFAERKNIKIPEKLNVPKKSI
jgi:ribonucleoside-triphosphate reductase